MLIVSKIHFETLQYTRRRDKWISLSKLIGIYCEISFFTIQWCVDNIDNWNNCGQLTVWHLTNPGNWASMWSAKCVFFGPKKMRFMQIESVLQTINRSEPAKNRFSVALVSTSNHSVKPPRYSTEKPRYLFSAIHYSDRAQIQYWETKINVFGQCLLPLSKGQDIILSDQDIWSVTPLSQCPNMSLRDQDIWSVPLTTKPVLRYCTERLRFFVSAFNHSTRAQIQNWESKIFRQCL